MRGILTVYLIFINITAAAMCVIDKKKAINGSYRISEKALFTVSLIGGGLGFYIAMYTVRHKTKHIKFVLGIPLITIMEAVVMYLLLTKL